MGGRRAEKGAGETRFWRRIPAGGACPLLRDENFELALESCRNQGLLSQRGQCK